MLHTSKSAFSHKEYEEFVVLPLWQISTKVNVVIVVLYPTPASQTKRKKTHAHTQT